MIALLSRSGVQKVLDRLPYLSKEDFLVSLPSAGTLLELNEGKKTIGYGYSGRGHRYDASVTETPLHKIFFTKKLRAAYQRRQHDFDPLPQAYRLIHNEADEIPGITIEIFLTYAVVTYFNQGILAHEQALVEALQSVLKIDGIYAKYRTPEPSPIHTKLIWGEPAPEEIIIEEGKGKYAVRIMEGLMTGLFLDQRANRDWLQKHSDRKRVCNTFSYTGSLSIACGLGNAYVTRSIDLSRTYSDWCRHNLALNDLLIPEHESIASDTFAHFAYCKRKGIKYDLIILDPPTFSKNKKGTFSVPDNYERLVKEAIELLSPKGLLMSCTNYSQWSLPQFKRLHQNWIARHYRVIHEGGADLDFPKHPYWPESEHLKCIVLQLN